MQTDIFGSAKQLQIRVKGAVVSIFWYCFETLKHIGIKDNPEILVYVTFKVAPQYFTLTIRVRVFYFAF